MIFNLVICGGIHPFSWTEDLINNLNYMDFCLSEKQILIIPPNLSMAYDGKKIYQFIQENYPVNNSLPLIFLTFSAGVVGGMIASRLCQRQGQKVLAMIAVDGWGVPLIANFPIHTISHDYFTHLTLIKSHHQHDSFYADPSVSHEMIWRSPSQVQGYWCQSNNKKDKVNALNLIEFLLTKYKQM